MGEPRTLTCESPIVTVRETSTLWNASHSEKTYSLTFKKKNVDKSPESMCIYIYIYIILT